MFKVIRKITINGSDNETIIAKFKTNYEAQDYIESVYNSYFNDDSISDEEMFNYSMNAASGVDGYEYKFSGIGSNADNSNIEVSAKIKIRDEYYPMKMIIMIQRDVFHILDIEHIDVVLDPEAICPTRSYESDAGLDLYTPYFCVIPPRARAAIDTGVHIDIPAGYVGNLESKSGLMLTKGIQCEGTIDSGYHGTIRAVIFNNSDTPVTFEAGSKITQLVISPVANPRVNLVEKFAKEYDRGDNGFGSTGV